MKYVLVACCLLLFTISTCFAGAGTLADRVEGLAFNKDGSVLAVLVTGPGNKSSGYILDSSTGIILSKFSLRNTVYLKYGIDDRLHSIEIVKAKILFRDLLSDKIVKSVKCPSGVKRINGCSDDMKMLLMSDEVGEKSFILNSDTAKVYKYKNYDVIGVANNFNAAVFTKHHLYTVNSNNVVLQENIQHPDNIYNMLLGNDYQIYLVSPKNEQRIDLRVYNNQNKSVYQIQNVTNILSIANSDKYIALGGLGTLAIYNINNGSLVREVDIP